jgi:hypothetical protein
MNELSVELMQELERRSREHDANPDDVMTREEVRQSIRRRGVNRSGNTINQAPKPPILGALKLVWLPQNWGLGGGSARFRSLSQKLRSFFS